MDKLSIVIPVYNGAKSIKGLCYEIDAVLKDMVYEIILVDDKSRDDSFAIIQKLSQEFQQIKSIKLKENVGQQNALCCGICHATGNYCITMDDDGQHNPQDILRLYEEVKKGYDVVYGIPIKKQHPHYRSVGTFMTDLLFNKIIGKPKTLKISSYRIINNDIIQLFREYPYQFIYLSAVIFGNTKKVANIEIEHRLRKEGTSNYNLSKLFKVYFNLLIYYTPCLKRLRKKGDLYEIEEFSR